MRDDLRRVLADVFELSPAEIPDDASTETLANWDSLDAAHTFFERWDITDEPGEVAITLLGDVGLVPDP